MICYFEEEPFGEGIPEVVMILEGGCYEEVINFDVGFWYGLCG